MRTGKLRLAPVALARACACRGAAAVADAPRKKLVLEAHCESGVTCFGYRARVDRYPGTC
jgi:two-component system CheB/CheR fusion protein